MERIAYIMRGLPGSGKSTLAQWLAGPNGRVHSTDEYFMVNGKFVFDGSMLAEYHDRNLRAFVESLRANVQIVVCDNTNSTCGEMMKYSMAARQLGYAVRVVEMPHPTLEDAIARTTHGVPPWTIERMMERWEQF